MTTTDLLQTIKTQAAIIGNQEQQIEALRAKIAELEEKQEADNGSARMATKS